MNQAGVFDKALNQHAIVSTSDTAGVITYVNEKFCEISGYSKEELLGQNHSIVNSGTHPQSFFVDMWKTISSGQTWEDVICNRRKNGDLYWVRSTIVPSLDDQGNITGYASVRTDVTDLVNAQEKIRIQSKAIEDSVFGISITDASQKDTPLVYVNPAFEKLTGYSAEELLGKSCRVLERSENSQQSIKEIRKSVREGHSVTVEIKNFRKDGSMFWNGLTISPVFDEKGYPTHFISFSTDITRQLEDQDKLVKQEKQYHLLADSVHDMISQHTMDGGYIFVTTACENILGLKTDEIIGHSPYEFIHPDDKEKVRETLSVHEDPEQGVAITSYRIRHKDGSYKWVESTSRVVMDESGSDAIFVVTRDITDRVKIANELKKSEERLRMSQVYANIGTWDWHIPSGELYWSERIAPMFGYEDVIETTYENFLNAVHPDDREKVTDAVTACVEKGEKYEIEHRVQWPDGSIHWVLEQGDVRRDEHGNPINMLGVVTDINRLKQAEQNILEAKESAEQANKAKSEFLSSMSHELRTPMNAILGFAQLLEMQPSLDEEQKDNVDEILKAGNHLLTLINEVLDLAKIESGKVDLSIEPVKIESLLDECNSLLAPTAQRHGVMLERAACECSDELILMADYVRLKQVVINLISNAIKYNRDNGRVSVYCNVDEHKHLTICIKDTGVGIPADKRELLFQPFSRLEADQSDIEGAGIGLMICKGLVEAMNGQIGFESEVGVGTTFWVKFTLDEKARDMQSKEHRHEEAGETEVRDISATVLYVEDNPSNLRLMENVIAKRTKVKLLSAHTGQLGLEMAIDFHPDLIILDINMPGMDGYTLLSRLQKMDQTKDTPVIALTADAMAGTSERAIEAGFKHYLTKPLDIPRFIELLGELLPDSIPSGK